MQWGGWLFLLMCIVLYAIPDSIQLPFRLLVFIGLIGSYLKANRFRMPFIQFFIVIIAGFIVLSKIYIRTFDTSLLMVFLAIIPVMNVDKYFDFSTKQIRYLRGIIYFLCFTVVAQLMIFRYQGRPNLSYEINQSGSYLFLFFLLCDVLKIRIGKLLVIFSSFLLLSRLLVLSIIVFYIVRFINKHAAKLISWLTYSKAVIFANIFIVLFSFAFLFVFAGETVSGSSDDASRLTNVVDGSNMVRFKMNVDIVMNLINGNESLLYRGYGDMTTNPEYLDDFLIMPHNELIKGIAQFGLVVMLFFFIVSKKYYSQYVNQKTLEYFIPIVLYTLILWVRFTIIPSFEMIFILFILKLKADENNFYHNRHYKLCWHGKSCDRCS